MRIDPHVHCRDGKQKHKATIRGVLDLARNQGVDVIFDMPNTDPPILTGENVRERLELVPCERRRDYFLYVGSTADEKQLQDAVRCFNEFDEVIGIKLFAGESTGNLGITDPDDQREIYKALSCLGYGGVLAVHCEKEKHMRRELWDPENPVTHSMARPKEAEIEAVEDQITFAKKAGYKGVLHICHASCPETVRLVNAAKDNLKITCGVTPHHVMWNDSMLKPPYGLLYKTNPPLRSGRDADDLLQLLKEGMIDWIESDHAPHTTEEKLLGSHPSGYPSLGMYSYFVDTYLPGAGIPGYRIGELTSGNIRRTFGRKLK